MAGPEFEPGYGFKVNAFNYQLIPTYTYLTISWETKRILVGEKITNSISYYNHNHTEKWEALYGRSWEGPLWRTDK